MKNLEKEEYPDYQGLLQELERKIEQQVKTKHDPVEHNDKTRSHIAKFLTYSYVGIVSSVLIGIPVYNAHLPVGYSPMDIKDSLLAVTGVFGGIYGFVIGHYFKRGDR